MKAMKTPTGSGPGAQALPWVFGVAMALLVLAALLALLNRPASRGASVEQLSLVTQQVPVQAQTALNGEIGAFDALARTMAQVKTLRAELAPAEPGEAQWTRLQNRAGVVMDARMAVQTVDQAVATVRDLSPKLLSEIGDLASGAGAQKLDAMSRYLERFELSVQRIQQDLNGLSSGVTSAAPAAQRLADSLEFLNQVIRSLSGEDAGLALPRLTGAENEQRLKAVSARYQQFAAAVRKAVGAAEPLAKEQSAARELPAIAGGISADLAALPAAQATASSGRLTIWIMLSLGLALVSLVALAWLYRRGASASRSVEQRVRENERNQEAIMRLLDELSSLADGDLTVQATVTEDITGAIADSINYAIEALRDLVTTINDTVLQLDGATKQTQAAANHMAKASGATSRQISSASESMADMAASIEEVSGNSERCSDVARHSVDIAHKGGDAVRRTIDGMNAIRETIQETSKRIKRLGESSQEIGNIVELINDIAEQTNILALNASIQASMAGEAGRGFAVVADEVQRLAERAANATKQIEVLVRTIQSDTNEAVVSMERSTTDVVGGALLAENAGAALEEIEQVSNQIASLVQNISASARQQAQASGNISRNMQVVRELSTQTAESSSTTSHSIGKLAVLAAQLRKSVSGFRLPDFGASTAASESSSVSLPALKEVPLAAETQRHQVAAAAPAGMPGVMPAAGAPGKIDATAKMRKVSGLGA